MTDRELRRNWVKERDQMLEKRDVGELIKFVDKWAKAGVYDKKFPEYLKNSPQQVQLMTLCKCICNAINVSKETRAWALKTLSDLGSSPKIY